MSYRPPAADPFAGIDSMPSIETERLVLRSITLDDAPALFAIFSDPGVMRYWSWPPLVSFDQAEALVREIGALWRSRALLQWGITRRERRGVIGTVTLGGWDRRHRRAELGYALAEAHQGNGYAVEAVGAAIAFGFGPMGLHRIAADTEPRNARSIRLLERLGFRFEGLQRQAYFQGGEWQDAALYGLLEAGR